MLDAIQATRDLTGPVFQGINLRTAKLIVWGVHHSRVDQVRVYCDARGIRLGEGEIHALASVYRNVFRVDVDRASQPECYLCEKELLPQEELLCDCYLWSVEGQYFEPELSTIEGLKKLYPQGWRDRLQATRVCNTCHKTFNVTAGDVAKQLYAGKEWKAPRWCRSCYKPRTTSTPPARKSNRPERKSAIPPNLMDSLPVTGES
jgi:hypothetical protein